MHKIVFLVLISFFVFSCNKYKVNDKYLDNEINEIIVKSNDILKDFGFYNYSIKIHFHKSIGNVPSSKTIKSVRAVGSGLLPILETVSDYDPTLWDGYIKTFTNDFSGYFEQRLTVSNYDHKRIGNGTIIYDYLSLLIIFDDISSGQKDELLNILNMYIGNSNRGDTIYITSKKLLEK
jgi:hypothetical protein